MKNKLKTKIAAMLLSINMLIINAYANAIETDTVGAGTKDLIKDALSFLQLLCPSVAGVYIVYALMRKSAADEADGKMWQKKIITAAICGIAGLLVMSIIKTIAGYYDETVTDLS